MPTRAPLLRALLYHRIESLDLVQPDLEPDLVTASPAAFDRQLRHLARAYHPVDAAELLAAVSGRHRLPSRAVVVTFDDGYRDFKELALPILRRHRIPSVLFVSTGFVDHPERIFWWDALWQMLRRTRRDRVVLPGAEPRALPLAADGNPIDAFRIVATWLKRLTPADRRSALEGLQHELGVTPEPKDRVLSWAELRDLRHTNVSIAAHTQTHELLDQVAGEALRREIEGSRDDIVRELGSSIPLFAYPNGNFSLAAMQALARAGFEAAFTTVHGASNLAQAHPLALRRDDGRTSLLRFAVKLTGPLIAYRNRRFAMPAYTQLGRQLPTAN